MGNYIRRVLVFDGYLYSRKYGMHILLLDIIIHNKVDLKRKGKILDKIHGSSHLLWVKVKVKNITKTV